MMKPNKHDIREKKFRALNTELRYLRDITWQYYRHHRYKDFANTAHDQAIARITQIEAILNTEFYNEQNGWFHTAPHWYRNKLNRRQRQKMKTQIRNWQTDPERDLVFNDNFKDAAWYW